MSATKLQPMNIKLAILLLIVSAASYSQSGSGNSKESNKSLLVVFVKNYAPCGYKAIQIKDSTVLIDTCYDSEKAVFTIDKTETVSSNILFSRLLNLSASQWKYMEHDINQIRYCDYAMPFKIEVQENNLTRIFSLNRISNCYPSSAKYYLEALDFYFKIF